MRTARLLVLSGILAACRSNRGAPDDLRGVFDRTASATATPAGSASSAPTAATSAAVPHGSGKPAPSATASNSANLDGRVAENRRKPVTGPCIATTGEPAKADDHRARRPACRRAEVLEHRGPDGSPRYACVFPPEKVEKHAPLPVVVFFHGQDESPAKVSKETELRTLGDDYDFTGDPNHRGFLILAPQARRIQLRVAFDIGYVSPDNEDVRATDRFLDELIKRGWVDPRRIYAVGGGKGGEMAAMWTMLHPDRVTAFATFGTDASDYKWTCPTEPPPAAVLYRACDTITSCLDVEQWLAEREQSHAPTLALRLGMVNQTEPSCELDASRCKQKTGEGNHYRWPKGKDRAVLDFLGRFSLDLP